MRNRSPSFKNAWEQGAWRTIFREGTVPAAFRCSWKESNACPAGTLTAPVHECGSWGGEGGNAFPYEQQAHHWRYDRTTRRFDLAPGRRPAGYVVASEDSRAFDDPGAFVEIPLVNAIRPRVKAWREAGWPGATAVTRRLLRYWNDPEELETRRFSDFGLNDAIEASLVKTPRVVVRDDALPDAGTWKSRLYHIYNDPEVKDDLNRRAGAGEPLPDLVLNGYYLLGYDWRETARRWAAAGFEAPPTMITVANRTETAARVKHAFDPRMPASWERRVLGTLVSRPQMGRQDRR